MWTDIRKAADHGNWDKLTDDRTVDMLHDVARFLAEGMPKP